MTTTNSLVVGDGERLQRQAARRTIAIKGTLFVLGLLSGGYLGYWLASNDFNVNAPWPRELALIIAITYVAAVIGGSMLLDKSIDEHERMQAYQAVAVPATAYMLAYPVWFLLWKAQLVIEPVHWMLFVGFWALLIGSAIYYRFR